MRVMNLAVAKADHQTAKFSCYTILLHSQDFTQEGANVYRQETYIH